MTLSKIVQVNFILLNDAGNWDLVEEIAASFVAKDLSLVDRADILFAYLPYKISTCGSHHEIINAQ